MTPKFGFLLFYFLIQAASVFSEPQVACKDDSGKDVDWFIAYKLPKIVGNNEEMFKTGHSYAVITSDTKLKGWKLSEKQIDQEDSIFGQTLDVLTSKTGSKDLAYIVYNDQPPDGRSSSGYAHAKGAIVSDNKQGFWLIHTVPGLTPDKGKKYTYPSSGARNGQISLCISMKVDEIQKAMDQLLVMSPLVISIGFPQEFAKKVPEISAIKEEKWKTDSKDNYAKTNLKSSGGRTFTSFSKDKRANRDLYSDIVGPEVDADLLVETWRFDFFTKKEDKKALKSECSKKHTTENVNHLVPKFDGEASKKGFDWSDDHSKWAISKDPKKPYVCVGDINRVETQFRRGGGTTCLKLKSVWNGFNEWVEKVDSCK